MDMRIEIRDRRNPGWYYINNEVYDAEPPLEALAIYNAIARYANNKTERAYFSGKKWKRHHKVGHSKLAKGMRWLIEKNLIASSGSKTREGAVYFDLLNTEHIKPPCSTVEPGGVSPQNTNYTINNTNKDNETKPADAPAPIGSGEKKAKGKKPKKESSYPGKEMAEPFVNGYPVLYNGRPFPWGKESGKWGKAFESLYELSGKDLEHYRSMCRALFLIIKNAKNDFDKRAGFTPTTLRSRWHSLQPVKITGTFEHKEKAPPFPDYKSMTLPEIETAVKGWFDKWGIEGIREHIAPDSYEKLAAEGFYAYALGRILDEENRERESQKKIA